MSSYWSFQLSEHHPIAGGQRNAAHRSNHPESTIALGFNSSSEMSRGEEVILTTFANRVIKETLFQVVVRDMAYNAILEDHRFTRCMQSYQCYTKWLSFIKVGNPRNPRGINRILGDQINCNRELPPQRRTGQIETKAAWIPKRWGPASRSQIWWFQTWNRAILGYDSRTRRDWCLQIDCWGTRSDSFYQLPTKERYMWVRDSSPWWNIS